MVKNIQMTSSPEPPGGFGSDHKQALIGWGKVGKNDAKFPIHEPFELES